MRSVKRLLSISLLLFTLAWSVWYIYAGLGNVKDPLFWLYKYRTLESGWMAIGSILMGGACVRLFGAELLPLRIIGWVCTVGAILIPYLSLLNREERRDNLHWLALAFGLMNYAAFQELSAGTFTVPILSSIATLAVLYRRQPSVAKVIAMGLLAGLAVTVRFPNVLVLLLLIPLVRKDNKWLLPTTVLTAGLIYLFGYMLITPVSVDPAMTNSHGVMDMINTLWERGTVLLGFMLMWIGVWAIGKSLPNLKSPFTNHKWLLVATGIIMGALLCYYVTFAIPTWAWYNIDLTYMICAGCLIIAAASMQSEWWWMAAILCVATMGTDVGWLKLFPAALCLLPVVGARLPQEMKRYLFPVFVGFAAAVMVRFSINSIGSSNLRYANVPSTVAPYTHIRITDKEEQWMKQVIADYDSLTITNNPSPITIVALGREMHRMRAITGCEAALYNEFWSDIFDSIYTVRYETVVEQTHPVVFCSFDPHFKNKANGEDQHSAVEEMLRAHGYREIDRSKYKYMIYIPQDNEANN